MNIMLNPPRVFLSLLNSSPFNDKVLFRPTPNMNNTVVSSSEIYNFYLSNDMEKQ